VIGSGIEVIPIRPSWRPGLDAMADAARCGARTRSGAPCRGPAVGDRARCRMHGGSDGSGSDDRGAFRRALSDHGEASGLSPVRCRLRELASDCKSGRLFESRARKGFDVATCGYDFGRSAEGERLTRKQQVATSQSRQSCVYWQRVKPLRPEVACRVEFYQFPSCRRRSTASRPDPALEAAGKRGCPPMVTRNRPD